jgi:hypothetical protein
MSDWKTMFWIAVDLHDEQPCKGGPGLPSDCDLEAPCWRHSHIFVIAERLQRWRAWATSLPLDYTNPAAHPELPGEAALAPTGVDMSRLP